MAQNDLVLSHSVSRFLLILLLFPLLLLLVGFLLGTSRLLRHGALRMHLATGRRHDRRRSLARVEPALRPAPQHGTRESKSRTRITESEKKLRMSFVMIYLNFFFYVIFSNLKIMICKNMEIFNIYITR